MLKYSNWLKIRRGPTLPAQDHDHYMNKTKLFISSKKENSITIHIVATIEEHSKFSINLTKLLANTNFTL